MAHITRHSDDDEDAPRGAEKSRTGRCTVLVRGADRHRLFTFGHLRQIPSTETPIPLRGGRCNLEVLADLGLATLLSAAQAEEKELLKARLAGKSVDAGPLWHGLTTRNPRRAHGVSYICIELVSRSLGNHKKRCQRMPLAPFGRSADTWHWYR